MQYFNEKIKVREDISERIDALMDEEDFETKDEALEYILKEYFGIE